MVDESKIIFFTGAPGSKWSAVAHMLTHNPLYPINTSDYSPDRIYTHPGPQISHLGAYWGPGFEFGNKFHKLNELSKDEIIDEIEKPYADKNWDQYRLIKCHQFSLNLDFIAKEFPKSKIIIVLRPDEVCLTSWLSAGGFDGIKYPDYNSYYQNEEVMIDKIVQENYLSRSFIADKNLELDVFTRPYLKRSWSIDINSDELEKYMITVERKKGKQGPVWLFDTAVARYNFD